MLQRNELFNFYENAFKNRKHGVFRWNFTEKRRVES